MRADGRRRTTKTIAPITPLVAESAVLPMWHESLAGMDWLALRLSPVYAGMGVPRGDGSAVVLVPGFTASDSSLFELHRWLERTGYRPYYSGIGRNTHCPDVHVDRLVEMIDRAYAETGSKVTVIGHSLGGCFARGAAMKRPSKVAQVISLGAPVQGARVHPLVLAASCFLREHGCSDDCYRHLQDDLPAGVAESCMFSKDDGIVDWHTCMRDRGAENIEVGGTHIGLIWNPDVYRAIAVILARTSTRSLPSRRRRARATAAASDAGAAPRARRRAA